MRSGTGPIAVPCPEYAERQACRRIAGHEERHFENTQAFVRRAAGERPAAGSHAAALKVGFVYVTPVGDAGWTLSA